MCGPVDDEKGRAKREEFLDDLSDGIAKTLEESGISIFSSSRILGDGETICIPDRPWPKRNGKRWTH